MSGKGSLLSNSGLKAGKVLFISNIGEGRERIEFYRLRGPVSNLILDLRRRNEGKVHIEENAVINVEKGLRSVGVPFDKDGIKVILNVDIKFDSITYFTRETNGKIQVNAMVLCSS